MRHLGVCYTHLHMDDVHGSSCITPAGAWPCAQPVYMLCAYGSYVVRWDSGLFVH